MGSLYNLGDYYMSSETTDQRAKQEQPQPKVVQLNEEFHPFQLRIESVWSPHEALFLQVVNLRCFYKLHHSQIFYLEQSLGGIHKCLKIKTSGSCGLKATNDNYLT